MVKKFEVVFSSKPKFIEGSACVTDSVEDTAKLTSQRHPIGQHIPVRPLLHPSNRMYIDDQKRGTWNDRRRRYDRHRFQKLKDWHLAAAL